MSFTARKKGCSSEQPFCFSYKSQLKPVSKLDHVVVRLRDLAQFIAILVPFFDLAQKIERFIILIIDSHSVGVLFDI